MTAMAGPRRLSIANPAVVWGIRITTFVLLLVAWEYFGSKVSRALFTTPSAIAKAAGDMILREDVIARALFSTASSLAIGFLLAVVVGVPVGLAMGRSRLVDRMISPYVTFLYALPTIALIPLLITWFGVGKELQIVMVFLAGIFLVVINTSTGVRHVDDDLVDLARAYCASERQLLTTVVMPAAAPFIFAGLRIAMFQCLVGIIVAEMTAALTGLGGLIALGASRFQTARVFVPILVLVALSIVLSVAMRYVESRIDYSRRGTGRSSLTSRWTQVIRRAATQGDIAVRPR